MSGSNALERELMNETRILKVFEITQDVLNDWRNRLKFPCVGISQRQRFYLASEVLKWCEQYNTKDIREEDRPKEKSLAEIAESVK